MTYHFLKKILGSRISRTYKSLMKILRWTYEKSYENLSFENRAPGE